MPTYSQGPRLLKGAIVAIAPDMSGRSTIVFQYNPETLKRSLEPKMAGGDAGQSSLGVRYTGAPVETFNLEVTIDAIDQLEAGQQAAQQMAFTRRSRRWKRFSIRAANRSSRTASCSTRAASRSRPTRPP